MSDKVYCSATELVALDGAPKVALFEAEIAKNTGKQIAVGEWKAVTKGVSNVREYYLANKMNLSTAYSVQGGMNNFTLSATKMWGWDKETLINEFIEEFMRRVAEADTFKAKAQTVIGYTQNCDNAKSVKFAPKASKKPLVRRKS